MDNQKVKNAEESVKVVEKKDSSKLLLIVLIISVVFFAGLSGFLLFSDYMYTKNEEVSLEDTTQDEEVSLEDTNETEEVSLEDKEVKNYVEKEFSLFLSNVSEVSYRFSTLVPEDAIIENTTEGDVEIRFNNSILKLDISDISVPETFESFVEIEDSNLSNLHRIVDQVGRTYYTMDIQKEEDCVEVGASAPCGSKTIEIRDNDNNMIFIFVEFVGEPQDLSVADSIVSDLQFVEEVSRE